MPIAILLETHRQKLHIGDVEYFRQNGFPADTKRWIILFVKDELIDAMIDKATNDCTHKFIQDLYDILSDFRTSYTN